MAEYGGSGRTMRVGIGAIGVVAAGIIAAIFFRGGGGGSGGAGSGTGQKVDYPATQTMLSQQPQRPLKVTIRESSYVVNGRPVDLATLTDLASKVPAGEGPAIIVQRESSSRAKAENDLHDALTKKGISYGTD